MDSDTESDEGSTQMRGIPGTIILINIFDPKSQKSAIQAHVATCLLIRHYLRTQSSHYIGIYLYGTDDDSTSIFATKSIKEIFPLCSPTLDDYKKLEETDVNSIKQSKDLVLSEVLAQCSKAFLACKKTLSSRTIVMLTSLDQLPAEDDQEPTLENVHEIFRSDIQIKIINISKSNYEIDQFYKDFVSEANKDQDVALPEPIWDSEKIKDKLIMQSDRHLTISQLPFEIGKDITMGVKIYKFLKSQTNPKTTYVHKETSASITSSIKTMKEIIMDVDQDQEQEIKQVPAVKTEILHGQDFGTEKVEFTDTEMKMMKNPFGGNSLKLLGFKPANILQKEKWYIDNCYFLFPSEEKIEGSTIAFKALYQACVEENVVAICALRARVNARPRLVALSPSTQPFGINVDVGFDVIIIPFVENLRELPVVDEMTEDIKITSNQREFMYDIVNSLKFEYKPEMFENPVLESKYRIIEAKALQDSQVAEIHDTTKPNEKIFEHIDDDKFYNLFGPFGAVATKRVNESKASSSGQKKSKTDEIDQDKLRENIKNKKVEKTYNVDQLKQILKSLNISVQKKKKDELVKLVYEHYIL
ncbi:X-ray repair cross-complementing protein 6 [Manduca sexta]|uniref:Ku domain-containing protein n=1 Tax=Manduca sexta TaxID=7130 RepID=A0A921Z605_MANSE|nr:X-ray repair cross-complementing protein 6 [Manduca sexta]KAG6451179.1 hypothetical protein O3G_MSEX006998 [Manduca sexta]